MLRHLPAAPGTFLILINLAAAGRFDDPGMIRLELGVAA
jgi:hypothetical protein